MKTINGAAEPEFTGRIWTSHITPTRAASNGVNNVYLNVDWSTRSSIPTNTTTAQTWPPPGFTYTSVNSAAANPLTYTWEVPGVR